MEISTGISPWLTSYSNSNSACRQRRLSFKGNILIIGAGTVGLTAGCSPSQHGVEFTIL